ncbi:lipid A biosynthesis protein [Croceitalea sp. MTPC5]|uniref:lysophospholipid acyltransferase family protein n=1 Tax=Croceitalea sp. MTPC5 TaxID=3056565 RepID=UPI002B3FCFF7|nr:lipid A biosynthesis protein [Croceitalea sp. MTPC5]
MQLLVFYLVYPILWVISRLPFKIIYTISDVLFHLIYTVIGYRKKVVQNNLELVFPDKSKDEILKIQKKFYRHMCDMFLEMIKTLGISNEEMQRRYKITNISVLNELEQNGYNCMTMISHYASWEWALSINTQMDSHGYGIYQKIQNKYFDRLIRDIRGKFGTRLIRTYEAPRIISRLSKGEETFTVGILSDQSPMVSRTKYWRKFMGITVPVHVGGEELCKKYNLIPLYLKVRKLKRGHYEATFKCLTETPSTVPNYEITDAFLAETEKAIYEAPEYYFWTHKRWKHRGKQQNAV